MPATIFVFRIELESATAEIHTVFAAGKKRPARIWTHPDEVVRIAGENVIGGLADFRLVISNKAISTERGNGLPRNPVSILLRPANVLRSGMVGFLPTSNNVGWQRLLACHAEPVGTTVPVSIAIAIVISIPVSISISISI